MPEFPDIPDGGATQSGVYIVGYRGSTDYRFPFDNLFDNVTTDDIPEGITDLYYTDERVDDRVATLIQDGTGIAWVYDDGAGTLTPTVSLTSFNTSNLSQNSSSNHYVQPATVSLDDTEIKSLNSTPVNFTGSGLGSLSSDLGIIINGVCAQSIVNTTGYTNSGIDIVDTSTGNILFEFPSTLASTVGTTTMQASQVASGVVITSGGNIAIKAKTGDPTGGNAANTIKAYFNFEIVDFASI